jgi:hypothetical protein
MENLRDRYSLHLVNFIYVILSFSFKSMGSIIEVCSLEQGILYQYGFTKL